LLSCGNGDGLVWHKIKVFGKCHNIMNGSILSQLLRRNGEITGDKEGEITPLKMGQ
jgi:hypothetical protein